MYQTTEDCAGSGAPEGRSYRCICLSSYSWKYETGTVITFLFIQLVHGMGILWLVLVFLPDTVISASIFTAEVWAIIKALERIRFSCILIYYFYRLRQILLPSLLWMCLVSRLVYPTQILNTILTNQYILSTWQGNWNSAVANKLHSVKTCSGRLAVLLQEG